MVRNAINPAPFCEWRVLQLKILQSSVFVSTLLGLCWCVQYQRNNLILHLTVRHLLSLLTQVQTKLYGHLPNRHGQGPVPQVHLSPHPSSGLLKEFFDSKDSCEYRGKECLVMNYTADLKIEITMQTCQMSQSGYRNIQPTHSSFTLPPPPKSVCKC